MRKLILQMQTSLDGFVSTGPNDEQTWVTWDLDGIKKNVIDLLDATDTIIIGRKLAIDYIPFWQDTVTKPDDPMYEFAKRIVSAKKIVFTKTLDKSVWANTELAKGNLVDEIKNLKNQDGKDIAVYGGSSFVSALIKEGLIDEFHFYINPVALGKGVHIFDQIDIFQQLKLKKSITLDSGIVMLTYETK
ncbi:MAG: dihydrofolate reductase family protein [Ignavibacteria bacterium]|nr:dihydrofolate reductase family protein [Ignavibacteria bacterium]